MILSLIFHMLQLAGYQVLVGLFTNSVNFHTHDLVKVLLMGIRGIFGGIFGIFGGRGNNGETVNAAA